MTEDYIKSLIDKIRERLGEKAVPLSVILVEEFAREIGERISEGMPKPQRLVTDSVEVANQLLTKVSELARVEGEGVLREAIIEVEGSNVRLYVNVDGFNKIPSHSNVEDLLKLSGYLEYLDVIANEGTYIIHITNLRFLKGFSIILSPLKPTSLRRAFILYDIVR